MEEPMTQCSDCGKKIIEPADRKVQWLGWYYSHHHEELCYCNGQQIGKSSRTHFPEYPMEERMADLRGLNKPRQKGEYLN
jgi:hypothetical protein